MYNSHSLTHCCAWPAEGRSVLHIERSWPAIQAAPTDRPTSSSTCCSQFLPTLATHFSRAVPCKYTQYCLIVRTKFQNFSADNTLGPSMWEGVECIRVWGWAPYWGLSPLLAFLWLRVCTVIRKLKLRRSPTVSAVWMQWVSCEQSEIYADCEMTSVYW